MDIITIRKCYKTNNVLLWYTLNNKSYSIEKIPCINFHDFIEYINKHFKPDEIKIIFNKFDTEIVIKPLNTIIDIEEFINGLIISSCSDKEKEKIEKIIVRYKPSVCSYNLD